MYKEFEGKTESEAIDKAIDALGIDREEFDVEIVETSKKGLIFKKGQVRIRVHMGEEYEEYEEDGSPDVDREVPAESGEIAEFVSTVISKMGFPGRVYINNMEEQKQVLNIESAHSGILIGKKGKNLDALQLLANVYAGKIGTNSRIIIDAEGYRGRREEALKRLAN